MNENKNKFNLNIIFPFLGTRLVVFVFILSSIFVTFYKPQTTEATIAKYINFQGKLTKTSDGTNVANGSYAFEFKLYDAASSGSLLWTETYDQPSGACAKLVVTNAIFNTKLGSCNSLAAVDFTGGSLYLTVNFAPTGTSYDGEMSPRKQLVAAPFAFVANSLNGDGTINILNTGSNQATVGYDSSNKAVLNIGSTGFTTLTANGSGAGFNFAGGNVGVGSTSPAQKLDVTGSVGISGHIALPKASSIYWADTNDSIVVNDSPAWLGQSNVMTLKTYGSGAWVFYDTQNSAARMTIQSSTGNVGIGTTNPGSKLDVNGASRLLGSTSGYAGLQAASTTTSYTWTLPSADSSGCIQSNGSGTLSIATCGGSSVISSLTAAAATNSINNADYAQTWSWNTLSSNTGLALASTSTAAASNTQKLFSISLSGANSTSTQTTYGSYITNTHTGTSSTNVAGYFSASGGTNNYAAIFEAGNVGIGTTAPASLLTIGSGTPTTAANGLNFGTDTSANLYRSASAAIKTDGALTVAGALASGAITATGDILPGTDNTYNLGSATYRWQDLYLGPASLKIYNQADATNYDRIQLGYESNVATLRSTKGGTGTSRALQILSGSGSTPALYVNTSNNVGIGTTNPVDALDIRVANSKDGLRIVDTGSGNGIQFQGYFPAINLNSYWDGAATRAIGNNYTGAISLNPSIGHIAFFTGDNPGAGNAVTLTQSMTLLNSGNLGIGSTSPAAKLDIANATIANAGKLVQFTGTTTTATASGTAYGLYNSFTNANTTNSDTAYSIYNTVADATALANTVYGSYDTIALTGNAAKTGVGQYAAVSTSSTTADTIIGSDIATSTTGVITTGTRNVYGQRVQPASTAASTGGTTNVYGSYVKAGGTVGSGGTLNGYGLYVANGTYSTTGTTTNTGLYVESPTGADTNYGAIIAGGNVGIGTTAPAAVLHISGTTVPVVGATTTYDYTGGDQTYTVPGGVNSITVKMWGAGGGGGGEAGAAGGGGAYSTAVIATTPGENLTVVVGGGGGAGSRGSNCCGGTAGGYNAGAQGGAGGNAGPSGASDGGGGGGGGSLLKRSSTILAGAGGGGGGGGAEGGSAGAGGGGGVNGSNGSCSSVGGTTGGQGTPTGASGTTPSGDASAGGGGGGGVLGGNAGTNPTCDSLGGGGGGGGSSSGDTVNNGSGTTPGNSGDSDRGGKGGGGATATAGTAGRVVVYPNASVSSPLVFNGNLGIGTTSPGALLDIGYAANIPGTLRLAGLTSGNVTIKTAAAAGTWTLTLPTGSGTNGYVLQTDGSGITSWVAPGTATMAIGSAVSSGSSGSVLYVNSSGQLAQDNANFFWDATNKRLGIGYSSPGDQLTVRHATAGSAVIGIYDASGGTSTSVLPTLRFGVSASNGFATNDAARIWAQSVAIDKANINFSMYNAAVPSSAKITFQYDGNVGIGSTTPTQKLDVVGSATISTNVGIGSTAPAYPLDVAGNIRNTTSAYLATSSGNVAIGTTSATTTRLQVGTKVADDGGFTYDSNAMQIIHQTPTATATLNDPKTVLMLSRQGTGGQAYGAAATFNLSRYENSSVSSRTRLDISLAHGNFDPTSNIIMTYLSSGNVGVGTTAPVSRLTIGSGTQTTAAQGLNFGTDATANLYRSAAGTIKTDGAMVVTGALTVASCSGCGGSFSGLTAATATNSINNADYAQTWSWNTLSSNTGLALASTSTAAASNTQKLFSIALSGANSNSSQTTYGGYITNTHTGTSSTNVGLYVSASGGTNNYAAIFNAGNVGIGVTTPYQKVSIAGDNTATYNAGYLATDGMLLGQSYTGPYFGKVGIKETPWVTNNAGSTWVSKQSGSWWGIAMSSDGRYQTATSGYLGYLYVSSDYGNTWTSKATVQSWAGVAMSVDGRVQTALLPGGQAYVSYDYGATWTAKDSNRNWQEIAMSSDGKIQVATVNYGGQIYVSYDYGATWTAKDSARNWYGVAMSSDGKIMSAVVTAGQIYVSYDYGATWTAKDSNRNWLDMTMSADGKIQFATTSDNYLYVSTDYGATWTAKDSIRSWQFNAMSADGKVMAVNIYGGQIYISTDYGATWTAKATNQSWRQIAMSSDAKVITSVVYGSEMYISYADSYMTSGNVGIGSTSPGGQLDVTNATIANAGKLVNFVGTTTTSTASGTAYGLYNSFTNANTTNADTAYSIYNTVADATALANTVYGGYATIALSGNAAKTGVGQYITLSTSSTTADTAVALDTATTVTGIITSGTRNIYGARLQPTAGAESTGGTTNVYGAYVKSSADVGAGGTVNNYGLYIANGTYDTDGTSQNYGLYVESPTGADTNYAAAFAGGNVGIGTQYPTMGLLHIQKNSTYSTEDAGGIDIVSATSDSELILGADATNDFSYIQSAQHGTSFTTRPLMLMPNGGNVGVGTTAAANKFVVASDGSAGTPTISFATTADSDTGLFHPAANAVAISTAGTERIRIDTNGVGIGTTGPATALHVVGNGRFGAGSSSLATQRAIGIRDTGDLVAITFEASGTNGRSYGIFSSDAASSGGLGGAGNFVLFDQTANAARLTINSGGNVGIGTTSPADQLQLSGATATKSSGTTWSNPSDSRLKENINPFTDGLDVINAINPVTYTLNGLGGTPKGLTDIGVIAQEIQPVAPYTISTYEAKLHPEDTDTTSLLKFNASALTFVTINAIKELNIKVDTNNESLTDKLTATNQAISTLQLQISNLQNSSGGDLSPNTPIVFKDQLYLSGDSVGQAKIIPGSTSVRVTFSKPYQQQPIVTVTPNSKVGGEYWVGDKDSTGFTVYIDRTNEANTTNGTEGSNGTNGTDTTNGTNADITFDWHAFASPDAKLTLSDGTTENIILITPPPPAPITITIGSPTNNPPPLDETNNTDETPTPNANNNSDTTTPSEDTTGTVAGDSTEEPSGGSSDTPTTTP